MTGPADTFAFARAAGGYAGDVAGEAIPVLTGYRAVREAAGDWQALSNDAPGRIQIPAEDDIRSLRQLPIETDPPRHSALKALVQDWFRRPRSDPAVRAGIEAVVAKALDALPEGAEVDALQALALPIQSRALAVLLGLPLAEAEGWIGWGLHAFKTATGNDPAAADRLLRMIEAHADRALSRGGDDFFGHLARARLGDRPLSRDEIIGFAHVTFAGGRDTLILCIAAALAHFARAPEDLDRLRDGQGAIPLAVEEIFRHTSPLTHIGRICTRPVSLAGLDRGPGDRVALCWAAANLDPERFDDAATLRIDRAPNPHVAFGSGPHACLGATHAREVLRALVAGLATRFRRIAPVDITEGSRSIGGPELRHGFDRLCLRFHRK
ncbi:MAG: Cytochrome P450 [Rhodobacteraceae bacterium HLUCCA08]|nr:MAG: Cytochrome P450 [Rhodobacteraceae bacterium HLUCCA08]